MRERNGNRLPVEQAFEMNESHELVTHQGEPLLPPTNTKDAQKHMGALEDNVTPIMPLVAGPLRFEETEDEHYHALHRTMTAG